MKTIMITCHMSKHETEIHTHVLQASTQNNNLNETSVKNEAHIAMRYEEDLDSRRELENDKRAS